MFCDRCGVANRAGRTSCVQCLGPLLNGTGPGAEATCAEHPDTPATGRCVTCKKMVCDACGGVVNNRGVYCIDHTPVVTTSARSSPGMNPLLAGAGGDAGMAMAATRTPTVSPGTIMAISGLLALILAVVALLVWPGFLKSKPIPASPMSGYSAYGGGMGMDPYGGGGMPGGPMGTGGPYGGGGPYGSGGPMGSSGPYGGGGPMGSSGPYGTGGPGGAMPGGPMPGAPMPGGGMAGGPPMAGGK